MSKEKNEGLPVQEPQFPGPALSVTKGAGDAGPGENGAADDGRVRVPEYFGSPRYRVRFISKCAIPLHSEVTIAREGAVMDLRRASALSAVAWGNAEAIGWTPTPEELRPLAKEALLHLLGSGGDPAASIERKPALQQRQIERIADLLASMGGKA